MQELQLFSPAKINLFLHITGQRDDGYHNLQSVFRALDFGDELSFRAHHGDELIVLSGADDLTANLDDNLIIKAARALSARYPNHAKPTHITLNKRIPTGAGLGGGSSNCATTLIALNQLWDLRLDTQALIDVAATLGADVPFFIFAHAQRTDAIATGIGEVLSPIRLPKRKYLLLMPQAHLSTAHFFKHPNLQKDSRPIDDLAHKITNFDTQLVAPFYNCFESIATQDSSPVKAALDYLRTLPSSATARMTGTGSVVYLPLTPDDEAQAISWQNNAPCQALICESLYGKNAHDG